ncbi:hypothetical protein [Eubacterium aggregans]|uniref:hypothetical protein n=1 Tax=Eubacterium aggregans TaxID=81409 RepID=UPI000B7CE14D|nr:hypothetical protein [Eubacterium aggregans]
MKSEGIECTHNGKRIYHENDKPTPAEIGAAKSSHTHDDRYYTADEVDDKITGASGNTVTVSTTAPANPRKGDIWI